ncbi:twin-arginine translocase subunit TatC [Cellulomonas sp. MW9]|uniref:Sec-independent protein translocase protein TatC n=2 Tax=Cellulomonas edaphi TaxID=3053468 RepID=A0ABT7S6C8_9CELL|nr:twin-arginine translocase subunit TatC [Cellulomons edaphi]
MPLRGHLVELRRRVVLSALGILAGAVLGWFFYEPVFEALQRPILQAAASRDAVVSINFGGLATAIDMQVKVSVFLGVLISSPWWLYQLWAFINPGLNRTERIRTYGFLGAAIPMFLAGAAFAALMLPNAVRVLTEFTPDGATNLIDAQTYLSFVMRFVLAFGIAFLLPVVMVSLTLLGVVRARTWARGWRWAVLLSFTFAAVMTPTPDVLSMIMLALPVCGLYFLALAIGTVHDRREDRRRVAAGLPRIDGTTPSTEESA